MGVQTIGRGGEIAKVDGFGSQHFMLLDAAGNPIDEAHPLRVAFAAGAPLASDIRKIGGMDLGARDWSADFAQLQKLDINASALLSGLIGAGSKTLSDVVAALLAGVPLGAGNNTVGKIDQGVAGASAWAVADAAVLAVLQGLLVELGQKLEPGQEVALSAATLAALETINTNATLVGAGVSAASPLFAALASSGAAVGLTNPLPVMPAASTEKITAVGAAAAAVTLTLPAPPAGQFHYIDALELTLYSSAARTGSATPVTVSSTNLGLTWTFESAGAIGTAIRYALSSNRPAKSSAAATATTIVCPAVTGGIWRVNAVYSVGP